MAGIETGTARHVGDLYDSMMPTTGRVFPMHHGYWDADPSTTLREAEDRLTDMLIDIARLAPEDHLLDIGCGCGQPTLRLARATGARATGLSAGTKEIALATAAACAEGLDKRVRFEQGDATQLPYRNNTFDAAWAIGSFSYIADKSAAAREVKRVLRPGGRFVLADLTLRRPMPPHLKKIWKEALFELSTPQALHDTLTQAGLEITYERDITSHTRRSWLEYARVIDQRSPVIPEVEHQSPQDSFLSCVRHHRENAEYVDHRIVVARQRYCNM